MALRRLPLLLLAFLALPAPGALAAAHEPGQVVVGLARPGQTPRVVVRRVHDVERAMATYRAQPGVAYAVPNAVASVSQVQAPPEPPATTPTTTTPAALPPGIPDDPGRGTTPGGWRSVQWNFLASGFGIDIPDAWAHAAAAGAPGGKGVTIAVLDTGVAYANRGRFRRSPDLAGTKFVRGYDFVDNDPYPEDHFGHGTHVASTIAETTDNGVSLTGIAYNATIMPVRVLDSHGEGNATAIARGVRFATAHGAQIINLSLEFSTDLEAKDIPQLLAALRAAHRKGILVVAASGNEAQRVIAYPARAPDVISVGATTEHGCLSDFSNDGAGIDLVAPGGGADAVIPGDPNCKPLERPGRDIFQMTFLGSDVRRFGLPSGYEGTSMAVPHVSGVAALMIASKVLGAHPTPAAIEARLKATARDLGAPGYDIRYGAGLIDANRATMAP